MTKLRVLCRYRRTRTPIQSAQYTWADGRMGRPCHAHFTRVFVCWLKKRFCCFCMSIMQSASTKKRQITHYNPSHRNCLLVFSRCNLHAITQQPNNKIDARQQQQNRERIEEKNKCERNRNGLANAKGNECLSTFSLLLRGLFCWFFLLLFVVVVAALWCRQQWQFVHLHRCTVVRMAPYAVLWLLAAIAMHHPSTSTPLACDRFVLTSLLICSVW